VRGALAPRAPHRPGKSHPERDRAFASAPHAGPPRPGRPLRGPPGLAARYAGPPAGSLRLSGLAAGGPPDGDASLDAAFAATPYLLDDC
jgi:hypothetical protein